MRSIWVYKECGGNELRRQNEQDILPSFAETYEALEKVKAFFYAHSVTDADREHKLGLEKSYFQLRQNSAKKQKTMYDFLLLKKVVFRINRFPTFVCFLHSLEKRLRFYYIHFLAALVYRLMLFCVCVCVVLHNTKFHVFLHHKI
jgi:hypothetical protein